jgi:hypothetical protein
LIDVSRSDAYNLHSAESRNDVVIEDTSIVLRCGQCNLVPENIGMPAIKKLCHRQGCIGSRQPVVKLALQLS